MLQRLGSFIKGIFNFFVGDWIILAGVVITLAIVVLLENIAGPGWLKAIDGFILFLGVALTLTLALYRETSH